MKALSLVGYKKSGKTGLLVELAKEMARRGLSTASVKFSHGPFDKADTDTSKLMKVSKVVAGMSEAETAVFWPGKRYLLDLLPMMDADVLLIEGGKNLGWLPRVLLLKEEADARTLGPDLALATFGKVKVPGLPDLDSVSDLADLVLERGFALPGLDCGTCGNETCRGLAGLIVSGKAGIEDCKASSPDMNITVNGKTLGLNPFVKNIIAGSIRGMLVNLKGYGPGRIEISMDA